MTDEVPNYQEIHPLYEEEKKKKLARKGASITMALIVLGFDRWKDLEPGNCISLISGKF